MECRALSAVQATARRWPRLSGQRQPRPAVADGGCHRLPQRLQPRRRLPSCRRRWPLGQSRRLSSVTQSGWSRSTPTTSSSRVLRLACAPRQEHAWKGDCQHPRSDGHPSREALSKHDERHSTHRDSLLASPLRCGNPATAVWYGAPGRSWPTRPSELPGLGTARGDRHVHWTHGPGRHSEGSIDHDLPASPVLCTARRAALDGQIFLPGPCVYCARCVASAPFDVSSRLS